MAIGDDLRSVGIIGQGLVSGRQRARQAKTQGLATALGISQRGEDIRRSEKFREEDISRADEAQDLQIQQVKLGETRKLLAEAKLSLADNSDYQNAVSEGNQDVVTAFERQAYEILFSRLPEDAQNSRFAPYAFDELAGGPEIDLTPGVTPLSERRGPGDVLRGLLSAGPDLGGAPIRTREGALGGRVSTLARPGSFSTLGGQRKAPLRIGRGLVPGERREDVPEWLKGLLQF